MTRRLTIRDCISQNRDGLADRLAAVGLRVDSPGVQAALRRLEPEPEPEPEPESAPESPPRQRKTRAVAVTEEVAAALQLVDAAIAPVLERFQRLTYKVQNLQQRLRQLEQIVERMAPDEHLVAENVRLRREVKRLQGLLDD